MVYSPDHTIKNHGLEHIPTAIDGQPKKKRPRFLRAFRSITDGAVLINGGGGGNRTRVQEIYKNNVYELAYL